MSGLLSTMMSVLTLATNVSEDGAAKGTLNTLQDKKVKLLKADGSMMKVLGDYIIEPIAVVSNDLRDVDELDNILGLHMDLFTSYYMQVYDVLTQQYGIGVSTAIDTLGTDNGGLMRGVSKGLSIATESIDSHDYLGDLIKMGELSTESDSGLKRGTPEYLKATSDEATAKVLGASKGETMSIHSKVVNERKRISATERAKYDEKDKHDKRVRDEASRSPKHDRIHRLNRDTIKEKTMLHDGMKDLLIPNAIQRTLDIIAEVPMAKPGTDGQFYTRTYHIPVTVKLAVIFTSTENLVNMVSSENNEYAFSSRLEDYRAGAISMADFLLATDLIKRYKKHKLKDKDGLMAINRSRELSGNSKMITNGFAGFEKFYNMYILSPEDKAAVSKAVGANILTTKGKDAFLAHSAGISVSVADPDYERLSIQIKDIRGKTDLSFKKAIKKDKNDSDYGEIIKALMANKTPSF